MTPKIIRPKRDSAPPTGHVGPSPGADQTDQANQQEGKGGMTFQWTRTRSKGAILLVLIGILEITNLKADSPFLALLLDKTLRLTEHVRQELGPGSPTGYSACFTFSRGNPSQQDGVVLFYAAQDSQIVEYTVIGYHRNDTSAKIQVYVDGELMPQRYDFENPMMRLKAKLKGDVCPGAGFHTLRLVPENIAPAGLLIVNCVVLVGPVSPTGAKT